MINELNYQLDNYGDCQIHIDWNRWKPSPNNAIFFNRIINDTIMTGVDKRDKKVMENIESDEFWITNYPY